jgi:hypothetical protein
VAGRSTESLDLMPKLEMSSRVAAASFFLMSAVASGLAWGTYLFGVNAEAWRGSLEYALSPENEYRAFFILMAGAGVFSLVALGIAAFAHSRTVLRVVLIGGVIQSITYAVFGAWFLAFLAATPLWWVHKVEHEV